MTFRSTILLVAAFLVVLWQPWQYLPYSSPEPDPQSSAPPKIARGPEVMLPPEEEPEPPKPSPLAREINSPSGSVERDLEILHEIFADFRLLSKTGNPTGNNLEITSVLTGNNRYHLAPIPRSHPAISPEGELLDRFGTPLFFHNLSAEFLEIRSAGPDQRHHTADDLVRSNLPENQQAGF